MGLTGCAGVVPWTLKSRQTAPAADTTRGIFFTLGLACSPCYEGVCLHEWWSKLSTSPAQIHCCHNYSKAIYHCKSSDYSAEWLLMNHSSDSFPAQRAIQKYWQIALTFMSARQTGQQTTAGLLKSSQNVYYEIDAPNCSEKLVRNHSHCLQSCWEEITLHVSGIMQLKKVINIYLGNNGLNWESTQTT